ncbi:hypothetical protein DB43_AL00180 [Parachlamydia acanthamoebae]|jgi:hypothetical protein|uniref:Uncharacterized protein n=1 Tax=Parachlamydia acanthamoebae TaxID=83552 RepID=A0A0C1C532_9BACT|nr:hypothetical protein DB43_AL00180 [Parachlamydia acanthamoebae]
MRAFILSSWRPAMITSQSCLAFRIVFAHVHIFYNLDLQLYLKDASVEGFR